MPPRVEIIKRIKDDVERPEPVHVEACILDIRMIRFQLRCRLKFVGNFFRHLYRSLRQIHSHTGVNRELGQGPEGGRMEGTGTGMTHQRFRLLDVLVTEEELAV